MTGRGCSQVWNKDVQIWRTDQPQYLDLHMYRRKKVKIGEFPDKFPRKSRPNNQVPFAEIFYRNVSQVLQCSAVDFWTSVFLHLPRTRFVEIMF